MLLVFVPDEVPGIGVGFPPDAVEPTFGGLTDVAGPDEPVPPGAPGPDVLEPDPGTWDPAGLDVEFPVLSALGAVFDLPLRSRARLRSHSGPNLMGLLRSPISLFFSKLFG